MASQELKHGPLAVINPDKPKTLGVIIVCLDDEYLNNNKITISELAAINTHITVITNCKEKLE